MVHPLLKLRISLHYRLSFMIIFLPIIFLSGPEALKASSDLSPVALFTRCYGQITQTLPAANNPILASVAIGNIDPIEGCLTVLRKGIFAGQNSEQIADATNREALRVVETFHNLHASWFYTKTFPAVSQGTTMTLINDLMDQTQPALYITRALFGPQVRADSIVTLNISLRPIRTTAAPTVGAFSNKTPADLGFNPAPPLAPTGALLGVTGWPASVIPVFNNVQGPDIARHYGGGFLGDQVYLRMNLGEVKNFASNGAERMPRKWSRAVFNDALCRDIPVIRLSDAQKFVSPSSSVPFRTSVGCTVCHASADRLGMAIRGVKYFQNNGVDGIVFSAPTGMTLVDPDPNLVLPSWPAIVTPSFDISKPSGVLYLRDLKGTLLQLPLGNPTSTSLTVNDSLRALGSELARLDDFYVCLAKRYYQYFTGVDVELADPASPDAPRTLTNQDRYHLEKVTALGEDLKSNQSIMKLIEQIVKSIDYRKTNYGQ